MVRAWQRAFALSARKRLQDPNRLARRMHARARASARVETLPRSQQLVLRSAQRVRDFAQPYLAAANSDCW